MIPLRTYLHCTLQVCYEYLQQKICFPPHEVRDQNACFVWNRSESVIIDGTEQQVYVTHPEE